MDASVENGAASNSASSRPVITICEVQCGVNVPSRKRKSTSYALETIKRVKSNNSLQSDQEGMTRTCEKCGVMIECAK